MNNVNELRLIFATTYVKRWRDVCDRKAFFYYKFKTENQNKTIPVDVCEACALRFEYRHFFGEKAC